MSCPYWKLRLDASRNSGCSFPGLAFQPLRLAPGSRARCPLLGFLLLLPARPFHSDPSVRLVSQTLHLPWRGNPVPWGGHSPVSGDSG